MSSVTIECIRDMVSLGLITRVLVRPALIFYADVEVIRADVHIADVVWTLRVDVWWFKCPRC